VPSKEQIQHVFRHLDLNGDDAVNKEELAVFLRHLFKEQLKQTGDKLRVRQGSKAVTSTAAAQQAQQYNALASVPSYMSAWLRTQSTAFPALQHFTPCWPATAQVHNKDVAYQATHKHGHGHGHSHGHSLAGLHRQETYKKHSPRTPRGTHIPK
jgi:hypothetical protein